MKKKYIAAALVLILLCLAGYCLLNPKFGISAVKNPYEMRIGGKIISIYDKEEDIDSDLVMSVYDFPLYIRENESGVYVNKYGEIRILFSDDRRITTYKNIHVGDKAGKIEKSFDYVTIFNKYDETDSEYDCYVAFDDKYNEIDRAKNMEDNAYTVIHYFIEDNRIRYIMITDGGNETLGRQNKPKE